MDLSAALDEALDLPLPLLGPGKCRLGHFGQERFDLPWERRDQVHTLREACNLHSPDAALA